MQSSDIDIDTITRINTVLGALSALGGGIAAVLGLASMFV